jgi:hypothetical protein
VALTPANIDSVDTAMMDALVPLLRTQANPNNALRLLDRWAGHLSTIEALETEVLTASPAVLIGFEKESTETLEQHTGNMSGIREAVTEAHFLVIVVCQDVRVAAKVVKGARTGPPGAYALARAVKARLNNLVIDGTYHGWPLRYVGAEPFLVERGVVYSLALRFAAYYVESDAELPDDGAAPFAEVDTEFNRFGNVDLPADGTTPPPDPTNPLQNPRVVADVPIEQE